MSDPFLSQMVDLFSFFALLNVFLSLAECMGVDSDDLTHKLDRGFSKR